MLNLKIIQQSINPQALKICQILQQANFQAFIVGGCVRDLLLNHIPKDWDITTDATPQQVMELFPRNHPTGLQHGTVTVIMGEGVENHFEITTFRTEGIYLDGRRPEEVFFVKNIEQDLARRDLTINAIAYDPIKNQLIDPFNGQLDLQNGVIRAVGNPIDRFNEDGLRIIRAARFAARFNYEIEEKTEEAMFEAVEILHKISKERIKDELCKILESKCPNLGLRILYSCHALDIMCPYLLENLPYRHILTQDLCRGDLETKIAFLYRHCTSTSKIIQELFGLKFSVKEIKKVEILHNLAGKFLYWRMKWSVDAYKNFMADLKETAGEDWEYTLEQLIKLMEAEGIPISVSLDSFKDVIVFSKKEMNINGNDLISMGIKPSPQIGVILNKCYREILKNPEHNTKEFLLDFCLKGEIRSSMSCMK